MDKDTKLNADQSLQKKQKITSFESSSATSGTSSNGTSSIQELNDGSHYSLKSSDSSATSRNRSPPFKTLSASSEESGSWVPLSKGNEQYNIKTPSTSHRPVSPPPAKVVAKLNKHKVLSEKDEHKVSSEGNKDHHDAGGHHNSDKSHVASDNHVADNSNIPPKITFDYISFEDDDDDDEEFIIYNPSGSVLKPVLNPYNKTERIRQANIDLFKEDMSATVDGPKIKFNECVYLLDSRSNLNSEMSFSLDHDSEKELSSVYADCEEIHAPYIKGNSDKDNKEAGGAKNGIPDGLKVKGINPKVLLVMVPNTSQDVVGLHSDNSSSSENEDVCVGHSVVTSSRIDNEDDRVFSEITVSPDQTKHVNLYAVTGDENIKDFRDGAGDEIDTEELDSNQNSLCDLKSHVFCGNNGGGDICYGLENNTGIQIKITCPNCSDILNCVEFCSSDNGNNSCSTNCETCVQSPHSCNKPFIDTESISSQHKTCTVLKQKNYQQEKKLALSHYGDHSTKSESLLLKKKPPAVKNTATNTISIKLNSKNNHSSLLKAKFFLKTESNLDKRKNGNKNKNTKKGDSSDEIKPSENFSPKKQNNLIKNKIHVNTSVAENDKENEKQSDSNNKNLAKHKNDKSSEFQECHSAEKYNIKKENNNSKQKIRPTSCPEHQSKKQYRLTRPVTAPVSMKRGCCTLDVSRLPDYNGFRSEYGLSEEQLQERRRIKLRKRIF